MPQINQDELEGLGFRIYGKRRTVNDCVLQFASGHGCEWTIHWAPEFQACRHGQFEADYSADELRVEFGNQKPGTPDGCLF